MEKIIRNVWYLYKLDWRRIFSIRLATLLIFALMVVPSLYAWFNIKALWDPYGNTGQIPIAVYSDDVGSSIKDKEVKVGKQVLDKLKTNHQLGWKFVDSKDEVVKGVKSGKYYAGIYVPKTFSKDLVSITTGTIKKPQILYYFNEKINAIAPKITDKGAKNIQEQVKDNFINTASKTLFTALKEAGYDIETNMVSINKVKTMILTTDEKSAEIDEKLNDVVALNGKLPDLKEKLGKANDALTYLPKIDEIGQKITQLNEKMPEIQKQGALILDLQAKIPEIQAAGKQLATVHSDFDTIEQTMTNGIQEAKQGITVIEKVQTIMPQIEKMGNQSSEVVAQLKVFAQQLQLALPSIKASIDTTMKGIDDAATSVQKLTQDLLDLLQGGTLSPDSREVVQSMIKQTANRLNEQAMMMTSLADLLENTQKTANSKDFMNQINQLRENATTFSTWATQLLSADISSQQEVNQLKELLLKINQGATNIRQLIAYLNTQNISEKVMETLTKLVDILSTAESLLASIHYTDLNQLLSSTHETIKNAIQLLEKYQKELPAIRQEIADADHLLNGQMEQILSAINKGAELYQTQLPDIAQKLKKASEYMNVNWPSTKSEILTTLTTVNEKFPEVEKALAASTQLIQTDWPSIKDGIRKAADAIRKSEETVNLDQVIQLMKRDVQKESDFFTNPVDLETTTMYPIANNGSASTPFYTALCLWVGALLFSSVATTTFFLSEEQKRKFTKRETYMARMMTFLTVAFGQSIIVTLGNLFLLGVDVKAPFLSILFTLLVGWTFMMIIYTLVGLFGTLGKGIAIILLVLSISGGGGNYPIQVSGPFFQSINPLLPFTYAVNLLRESAGGVYWPNAWQYILVLSSMFLLFLLGGILGYPKFLPRQQKTSTLAKKSHIF